MKVINLIIDVVFFTAASALILNMLGIGKLNQNLDSLLVGIVSGFSVVYSAIQIFEDIKDKPSKEKKVKIKDLKNPFK